MPIRVIAGRAKGRRLSLVRGESTRPVRDQVKEALFNILGPSIEGTAFLDLFAGTGSVGIEALSRGAAAATFVEKHANAVETIEANLSVTGLRSFARVVRDDVFRFLKAQPMEPFDTVYVAPPQYSRLWSRAVELLDVRTDWLHPDAWVIVQIDPSEYQPLKLERLREFDQRKYGKTLLVFYELPGE